MPLVVFWIDDIVAQGGFGVPVAKHQHRPAAMTVGGPLPGRRWIDVGVEGTARWFEAGAVPGLLSASMIISVGTALWIR